MSYTAEMFKKIISPIAIYRALYLRMVEQKFYFTKCDANGGSSINYASFKKYMKEERGKKEFYNWFFVKYLDGPDKSQFKSTIIDLDKVVKTLIPGEVRQGEKAGPIHVLLHLLGEANWRNNNPFVIDNGTTYTLEQVLKSDNVAKVVYDILNNKEHPYFRTVKKNLEIARKTSQMSTDAYIGKSNVANIIVNEEAYRIYKSSVKHTGAPNDILPPSPEKRMGPAQVVDPLEEAMIEQEAQQQVPSGQRKMTDFFTPQ